MTAGRKTPGEIIKELRKRKGLKQKEVAEAVGLTEACISRYENGSRKMTAERYERILEALGAACIVQF